MRLYSYFILLVILLTPMFLLAQKADDKDLTVQEYIEQYRNIAIEEMERSEIPASITLAQGIHESAYGNSRLAKKANNHFGIKCTKDWTGKKFHKWDDEAHKSCFRVYKNAEESYIDHTNFLVNRAHYAFLFEYGRKDYKRWAKGLRRAGYATDPRYPEKLIHTIEKYKLHEYDKVSGVLAYNTNGEDAGSKEDVSKRTKKQASFLFKPRRGTLGRKKKGVTYVTPYVGESLLAVAKRMNIPYKLLLKFNDLTEEDDDLIDYQPVYIYQKSTVYKGDETFHKVENDATMYEIAQHYGIKLSSLLARNLMTKGEEPKNGELIMLKEKAVSKPKLRPKNHVDVLPDYSGSAPKTKNNPIKNSKPVAVVIPTVKRPKPQTIELNTPTYSKDVYSDTSKLNTSKSKNKAYTNIVVRPEVVSTTTTTTFTRPIRRGDSRIRTTTTTGPTTTTTTTTTVPKTTGTGTIPNSSSSTQGNGTRPNTTIKTNTTPTGTTPIRNNGVSTPTNTPTTVKTNPTTTNPPVNPSAIYGGTKTNNTFGSTKGNTATTPVTPPAPTGTTTVKTNTTNNTLTNKTVHIVQKGETLYRIYKKYGVSVASIQKANQLAGTGIKPGDRLIIPAK